MATRPKQPPSPAPAAVRRRRPSSARSPTAAANLSLAFGGSDQHTAYLASVEALMAAFERWIQDRREAGPEQVRSLRTLREDSEAVYRDMWGRFAEHCASRGLTLAGLDAVDLGVFIDSLGPAGNSVTTAYARRMLRLIERIDQAEASRAGRPVNGAIAAVGREPRFAYADSEEAGPMPAHLTEGETRALISYLTTPLPSEAHWKEARNRAWIAVQLGAGLTPGEARLLRLEAITIAGGPRQGEPWRLSVPGNGNFPARDTPIAGWAGRVLAGWLQVRARFGLGGELVFPGTLRGQEWGKSTALLCFDEVMLAVGLSVGAGGSFRLRHTFALRQLTETDAQTVARWLGVQDPSIMERYSRVLYAPASGVK